MSMTYMSQAVLLCVIGLGISVLAVVGQIQDRRDVFVCNVVETKVRSAVEISGVKRRLFSNSECRLYLLSGKDWLSISIEAYESTKESAKKFSLKFDFLTSAEEFPEAVRNLNDDNFWSSAKGYHREGDTDHLILLRYKNINVTLISSSYDLILKIKPLIGDAISDNARVSASGR